jgi:hypothetical protein
MYAGRFRRGIRRCNSQSMRRLLVQHEGCRLSLSCGGQGSPVAPGAAQPVQRPVRKPP